MRRLLLLLPVCLALAPEEGGPPPPPDTRTAPPAVSTSCKLEEPEPPETAAIEGLTRTDPIGFLERCLERYDREVRAYRATLHKQERVRGKLLAPEVIDVAFRERPFSVRMDWRQGAGLAQRTAYVEGENGGRLLVLPAGWRGALVGVVTRDALGEDAKKSSRMPITRFGIRLGTVSTLAAWRRAKARGDLKVILRDTRPVRRAGGRTCWVLQRVNYPAPEADGITGETFYFDTQTWLQVGTVITGRAGLIGEYWFRDVRINPELPADTFTREGLRKKG